MNIVFLHIPKTAGQSVHHFLVKNFPKESIMPERVNSQIVNYTIKEFQKYNVYSGHFDISLLELVQEPKFIFTILREPIERILSYYFYLRKEAQKLSQAELNLPERQGMKAILSLSPDEYFCDTNLNIRNFIDDHYDNFYMYYFAMKNYHGRSQANTLKSLNIINEDTIFNKAINTLNNLNAVYDLTEWTNLTKDLGLYFPHKTFHSENIVVNKGDGSDKEKRLSQLEDLGATSLTFSKLDDYCKYDNLIYQQFCSKSN